jgi:L-aspartate oxidase
MDVRYLVNFDSANIKQIESSLVVLGSGVAGLFTAYKAAILGSDVIIITKDWQESNTRYAQGGIAAVLDLIHDSYQKHVEDTVDAGKGLCNIEAVKAMVKEGPTLVKELMEIGTHFDVEDGMVHLTKEGGHSKRRVLHSDGDQTGREIARSLQDAVLEHPNIHVVEGFAIDILTHHDQCYGVLVDKNGENIIYRSKATVIATGGLGQIYINTTNPEVATADGLAMAYRAGAEMMNMGFVQFHPTALSKKGKPTFLISEAVRGEGAYLVNHLGERFMKDKYVRAELEPRDVVAKAIIKELQENGHECVYLDINPLRDKGIDFSSRFPYIYSNLIKHGIDIEKGLIPVNPAAHYLMGGISVDLKGRTSIRGLYASGEVACAALHGANRLASNSLLDGLVFSNRIAIDFANNYLDSDIEEFNVKYLIDRDTNNICASTVKETVQDTMWKNVGLIRSQNSMNEAVKDLGSCVPFLWRNHSSVSDFETANMWLAAVLVTRSALWRKESRGSHYREDYSKSHPKYKVSDVFRR